MSELLAKDMKWPHCKGSIVPENTWNTELGKLMGAIESAKDDPWWICDTDLKYLNLRIDTRDNGFILTLEGHRGANSRERIDPQRVVDAIEAFRNRYKSDRPKVTFEDAQNV